MSKAIALMGESGSGKTTSMRNLNPSETVYIDCDGKGLSWKGWRNDYAEAKKNYAKIKTAANILSILEKVDKEMPEIKIVIIDTLNAVMNENERITRNQKGYDKWADNAWSIWDILEGLLSMRDDLTVVCVFHSQTEKDDNGNSWTRIKTNGRKLDKLVPESKFTTVLLSKRDAEGNYIFETQSNNSTAKSPLGAFENETIENDITKVISALEDF